MATCDRGATFEDLELPAEFADLEGLLAADLKAIVSMVTERAHERLFLTRREHLQLQARLWNQLTSVIQDAVEPLQVDWR